MRFPLTRGQAVRRCAAYDTGMELVMIEATQDTASGVNWGKFGVGRFTRDEWSRKSRLAGGALLARCGWDGDHVWVLDLQTGEGIFVRPSGSARSDLGKHQVRVCPLFEPFLEWLYLQNLTDLTALPALVEIRGVPGELRGYRRAGPRHETGIITRPPGTLGTL
jgi:hypothetical protein